MRKIIFTCSLLLLAVSCGRSDSVATLPQTPTTNYNHELKIGGRILMVEVANTPGASKQGLSNRLVMMENQGMLFDFGSGAQVFPTFWMKNMKFNLDLIWIYKNKIVGITADVPVPDVNCQSSMVNCLPTYSPPSPIDMVVEVNAGWAEKNNLKVGDEVSLK